MSKASAELSEASKESKDIGRIVRAAVKSSKLAHRLCVQHVRTVCSKITQTGKKANNFQAVKNYSVPQERKKHSTNVVQYFCLKSTQNFPGIRQLF